MADEVPGAAEPPGRRRALVTVLAGSVLVLAYRLVVTGLAVLAGWWASSRAHRRR